MRQRRADFGSDTTQRLRAAALAVGLALALLGIGAAPAAAAAGDARAVAAEASLTGTVLGLPVNLLDLTLSEVEVAQGDEDQTATDTLLTINLPIIGPVPLVAADVVTSTASSDHVRAQASSMLSDVSVNLPLGALPTVLTLDAIGSSATCHIVDAPTAEVIPPVSATLLGVPIAIELDQDIVVDIGIAQAVLRFEEITLTTDTATAIGLELALEVNILGLAAVDLDLTLATSACERGIAELPVAGSLDPASGPETGGTEVCVTGDKFVPDHTIVHIGTETVPAAEVEVIDGMTACFITPPHAPGVVDVTVETPGGVSSPPLDFEYVAVAPGQPVAIGLDPDSGPETGGTVVTISGDNFIDGDTSVHIGTETIPPAGVTVLDPMTLQFTTPAQAPGVVDVTVENSGGVSDPPLAFEYTPAGPGQPVADTIDPASGPESGGTLVTITGDNFVAGQTSVHIGTETVPAAEVNVIDAMTLELSTPAQAPGVVDVTVETPGGVSDPPLAFEYTPDPEQPVAGGIDPASGPETGGTLVEITGDNFLAGETSVHIGGNTVSPGQVLVIDAMTLRFTTPAHDPGVVDVTVETPGGVSDPPLTFEYLPGGPGQPVASDLDPASGPETGGTVVTISGENFVPEGTIVHIGAETVPAAEVNVIDSMTLQFTTPPQPPGAVDVTVETAGGVSEPPLLFEYEEVGGVDERLPAALEVDFSSIVSDANLVFEPGERVAVAPEWLNDSVDPVDLTGTAEDFIGPPGPIYTLVQPDADYGVVAAGATASCQETEICYEMEVGPLGVPRPSQHWDTTFEEDLSEGTEHTWTLHIGDSFLDTPRSHQFYRFIETIFHHEITVGCSSTEYCPGNPNTRAQMAVFVLRAAEGADVTPPPCIPDAETFDDVPASHNFCPWIEELERRGVVAGCGGGNYCPGAPVTRAQMPVFLLRTLLGSGYAPPACSGLFTDVPCPSTFANWIEDLFLRGITEGCAATEYCPANPVTRGQMAVFLTRTFGLVLYGP